MALDHLLAMMERRAADTHETPRNSAEVSVTPAPVLACTLDTPDTPQDGDAGCEVRMEEVIGSLQADPGLRYAVEAHDDADPDAVILTVAIRGEAACELRIPKSRYDAFALLELLDKHATRVTLQ